MVVVNGRGVEPSFEKLWHDCLHEESRIKTRVGHVHEENLALAASMKKGKEKMFPGRTKERAIKSRTLICRRSSVILATNQDTMLKITLAGKGKVDIMHLQPKQMKNLRARG